MKAGSRQTASVLVPTGHMTPARQRRRWPWGWMILGLLGIALAVLGVQAYTVHDFHPVFAEELVRHGATHHGLTWHYARPPVVDLEFEMDCRYVLREAVI